MSAHTPEYPSPSSSPTRVRVAVRLLDWSQWSRQVIRGAQGYAHGKPHWQLYISSGPAEGADIYEGSQHWHGIITHLFERPTALRQLIKTGQTKIVSITSVPLLALEDLPSLRVHDERIAGSIGRHLMAGGFRSFGYIGLRLGPQHEDLRAKALQTFAESEGIPCELYDPYGTSALSTKLLTRWVSKLQPPVGIVVWNMFIARQVLQACKRARVAVPAEAAVVAWIDDALVAESIEPTITGAVLPVEKLGYEAAALLDRLLSGEAPPKEPILIDPTGVLHVRQSSDVSGIADRDVHLAAQFIRAHAAEALRVHDVVKVLQISRSKFERDFLRVTGQTVNQAIIAAHLLRAKQLLRETNWTIEHVAEQSGFGTKQHFHHVFARQEGVTPAKYRQRAGSAIRAQHPDPSDANTYSDLDSSLPPDLRARTQRNEISDEG